MEISGKRFQSASAHVGKSVENHIFFEPHQCGISVESNVALEAEPVEIIGLLLLHHCRIIGPRAQGGICRTDGPPRPTGRQSEKK